MRQYKRLHSRTNFKKLSQILFPTCSRFFAVINSCPAPSITINSARAGINFNAAFISSIVPKPSRVPLTNIAGVCNDAK